MKILVLIFLFLSTLQANWKTQRESLDKLYKLDEFRVFYTLKGKDALPKENQKDLNKNQIPDYIENLAQRLKVSREVFVDILGFQNPLDSKRYKGTKYIDIHVLKSKNSSSGDGLITYRYKILDTEDKVVSMKLRNDLRAGTMTPSHEYFHLLQNSYSMFKNRWYTEGTAKWAERVFKKGTGKRDSLPESLKELEELLDESYKTKGFWRKLAYICDTNNGHFTNTKNLKTDVVGFPNLIEDTRIYGYEFMKKFLENLDIQDNVVSKKRGFEEFDWDEKEQKYNENNNVYILKALNTTLENGCKKSEKIKEFLKVSNGYINKYEK